MNPLPAPALSSITTSIPIADVFTKSLSRHRFASTISDIHTTPTTLVLPTTSAAAATVNYLATAPPSDLVPTLHPNPVLAPTLPIALDTGASFSLTPFNLDFLSEAPYGLVQSSGSVISYSKVAFALVASTTNVSKPPVDPCTLITGEDISVSVDSDPVDLSSTDSDSVDSAFDIWEFGTATLVFISNSKLTTILVEPTLDWTDWFDWIPLPRLTPPESYLHVLDLITSKPLLSSI